MRRLVLCLFAVLLILAPGSSRAANEALGKDANGNGVWDDLELYLTRYQNSAEQMGAYLQLAQAFQSVLDIPYKPSTVDTALYAYTRATECVIYVGRNRAAAEIAAMRTYLSQNPTRVAAMQAAEAYLRDKTVAYRQNPNEWYLSCLYLKQKVQ